MRGAGECAGDKDSVSRESAAELNDAAERKEQERLKFAALVVNSNKAIIPFCVERGQSLQNSYLLFKGRRNKT